MPATPSLLLTPQGVGLTDEKTDKEIAQDLLGREAGEQELNPSSTTPNSVPLRDLLLLHPRAFQQTPSSL